MEKLAEALAVYESAKKTCKEKQFIAKQIADIHRYISMKPWLNTINAVGVQENGRAFGS